MLYLSDLEVRKLAAQLLRNLSKHWLKSAWILHSLDFSLFAPCNKTQPTTASTK